GCAPPAGGTQPPLRRSESPPATTTASRRDTAPKAGASGAENRNRPKPPGQPRPADKPKQQFTEDPLHHSNQANQSSSGRSSGLVLLPSDGKLLCHRSRIHFSEFISVTPEAPCEDGVGLRSCGLRLQKRQGDFGKLGDDNRMVIQSGDGFFVLFA